jgi:plasmid stabilization system protein ParE
MSRSLLVSSRAHADIVAAHQHYQRISPALGVDFIRRLDALLAVVARTPQIFRVRHGKVRLAMMERFPFAVYFIWDESADFVSVRRVLHFAQHAPAHLKRSI